MTTDYGLYGAATVERCECMSAGCCGRVTMDDWQIPELQQRYHGHFPCHIEERIKQTIK